MKVTATQKLFEQVHAVIDRLPTPETLPLVNRIRVAIGLPEVELYEWSPGKFSQAHVKAP